MSEINGLPGSGNVSSVFHSSAGSSERSLGRGERRSRASSPAPFCLRLTFEERAALEALAGSMPLGAYIREKLLNGAEAQRRKRRKPLQDEQALARLLAELGNSRLANNLNQLATAANTGSLPVAPETVQAILRLPRCPRDADLPDRCPGPCSGAAAMILKGNQRGGAKQLALHLL